MFEGLKKVIKKVTNKMFPNSLSVGDAIVYEGHEGEIMEMYEETDEFEAINKEIIGLKKEIPFEVSLAGRAQMLEKKATNEIDEIIRELRLKTGKSYRNYRIMEGDF